MVRFLLSTLLVFCFQIGKVLSIPDSLDISYDFYINKAQKLEDNDVDSSLYYDYKALIISKENANVKQQVNSYIRIIYSEVRMDSLSSALTNYKYAHDLISNDIHSDDYIYLEMYYAEIYAQLGLVSKSMKILTETSKLIVPATSSSVLCDLHYYFASLYYDINNFTNSRKHANLSLEYARVSNNTKIEEFKSYMLLSNIYTEIDSALIYLNKAKNAIGHDTKFKYKQVTVDVNEALLYKHIGKLDKSRTNYLRAIKISKENNFIEFLASCYNNYSYLLMKEGNYDSAKIYLTKALQLVIELEKLDKQAEYYDSFTDYYEAIGDYQNALVSRTKSFNLWKESNTKQELKVSLFLSKVYETEQKENEILIQKNKIFKLYISVLIIATVLAVFIAVTIFIKQKLNISTKRIHIVETEKKLEVRDAIISGQDIERKRIAMDLHDGIGAKLGSVSYMVDGFFSNHKKYRDLKNNLSDIHQNVREISHRLLPAQLEELGLVILIKHLADSINKTEKFNVTFNTNLSDRLEQKLEINVYYIVFELINNAIKHSRGENIFVQIFKDDNELSISVEDDGKGFIQNGKNKGFGLLNVETRVEYLQGKLLVETSGSETIFMIEIPLD